MKPAAPELYHLVPKASWEQAPPGPYRAASLAAEGFVHCSYRAQVERVANLFYAAESELLLLTIDPGRLGSPVRDEDPGTGELFPHVYGPVDRPAIRAVRPMRRDAAGRWAMPDE